ncbi:legumin A [Artemisia annua]|uniref:Legumin A n=1 Tax=Artemisia annua TaxID=35608 RepID=A0A2U1MKR9_ARTAN|nr:legumin A [Artemisia annua]
MVLPFKQFMEDHRHEHMIDGGVITVQRRYRLSKEEQMTIGDTLSCSKEALRSQGQKQRKCKECSMKLHENIDDISKADFYNPQARHCTHLNSFKFPILQLLQLGGERTWCSQEFICVYCFVMGLRTKLKFLVIFATRNMRINTHNIIYVTNGNMRIQIVNDQGQSFFNDQVREQHLVVKRAGEKGCSWISFRTNDNAMINTLAGRTSAMRALPLVALTNAYQMWREEAQQLKYNRGGMFRRNFVHLLYAGNCCRTTTMINYLTTYSHNNSQRGMTSSSSAHLQPQSQEPSYTQREVDDMLEAENRAVAEKVHALEDQNRATQAQLDSIENLLKNNAT